MPLQIREVLTCNTILQFDVPDNRPDYKIVSTPDIDHYLVHSVIPKGSTLAYIMGYDLDWQIPTPMISEEIDVGPYDAENLIAVINQGKDFPIELVPELNNGIKLMVIASIAKQIAIPGH
jgi:hypothetical protein